MSGAVPELKTELMPGNHRMEAFSDGVFAIVVTIMIIEIRIPDVLAEGFDRAQAAEFGALIATYALSFLVISIIWTGHHYLTHTLPRPDRASIWLNNLLLFWVTLLPLTTQFFGTNPGSARAAASYGLVMTLCMVSFALLRAHAARLEDHHPSYRAIHLFLLRKNRVAIAICAASVPLAFVSVWLALICFVAVSAMFFLPVVRPPPRA